MVRAETMTALDMQPNGCIISVMHAAQKKTTALYDLDRVFKALADASRRSLLDRLHAQNGLSLGQLCEDLDMTRQAVTKHLRILERANLVAVVRQGREKLHFLNPVPIQEIADRWIHKYERARLRALSDLKQRLEAETDG
jgi:DNA-binding transcriptional ArsR family regulator